MSKLGNLEKQGRVKLTRLAQVMAAGQDISVSLLRCLVGVPHLRMKEKNKWPMPQRSPNHNDVKRGDPKADSSCIVTSALIA